MDRRITLEEEYLINLKILKYLYKLGAEMSIGVTNKYNKKPVNRDKSFGSIIFTKFLLHLNGLLNILPNVPVSKDPKGFNLPTICSLIRLLIETYFVFFYLIIDDINEKEKTLRLKVLEYYGNTLKEKAVKTKKLNKKSYLSIHNQNKKNFVEIKNMIVNDFPELTKRIKNIRNGRVRFLLPKKEISEKAGIDYQYLSFVYNISSWYIHTSFSSIYYMSSFNEFDEKRALEDLNLFLRIAINFSSYALRDFVKLFPELQPMIEDEIFQEILKQSVYLMKGGWKEDVVD